MAEEPQNPAGDESSEPKKKGFPKKTLGIVLGVAILQGAAFFAVFKFASSGPEAAHGEGSPAIEAASSQPTIGAEVELLRSFKVPNDKSGVLRIYDLDLSVVVPLDEKERMTKLGADHGGEIADAVARIVRGATDRMLREDDLRILRGQLLDELRAITRDEELVRRVLIPKFVPIRAE
jgi:flagellar basal body-associated protein FliL